MGYFDHVDIIIYIQKFKNQRDLTDVSAQTETMAFHSRSSRIEIEAVTNVVTRTSTKTHVQRSTFVLADICVTPPQQLLTFNYIQLYSIIFDG